MLPLVSSMTTTLIGVASLLKLRQRLQLAVVVDLEVLAQQIGDDALGAVRDGHVERDGLRADSICAPVGTASTVRAQAATARARVGERRVSENI